ncbi:MAG: hypothetical protein Q9190_001459 [Brigantiaea leucoxantha]
MSSTSQIEIGSVLVVGGCGFVGSHIVKCLLLEPSCTSVSVLSRNPNHNLFPNVSYHVGDITNIDDLRPRVSQIQPSIIFHTACPSAISAPSKDFEATTIYGTKNLLAIAAETSSVKAFVSTSSTTMAAGAGHINLGEDTQLADEDSRSNPYTRTKAAADKMVLAANGIFKIARPESKLRTACVRLSLVYGERDQLSIPGALAALEKRQTTFQLGDGKNLWDFVSADNAAMAHILLSKALLTQPRDHTGPKIDGEAFNITDGESHPFWEYPNMIWRAAGHPIDPSQVWVLPTKMVLIVTSVLEWIYWILTKGEKRPSQLSRQQVEYSCLTHTYCIDKAKKRLGYCPSPNFQKGIQKAVEWSLAEDGWSLRLEQLNRQSSDRAP